MIEEAAARISPAPSRRRARRCTRARPAPAHEGAGAVETVATAAGDSRAPRGSRESKTLTRPRRVPAWRAHQSSGRVRFGAKSQAAGLARPQRRGFERPPRGDNRAMTQRHIHFGDRTRQAALFETMILVAGADGTVTKDE